MTHPRRYRERPGSIDPLDVVAWPGLEHPLDQVIGNRRRRARRIVDRRANLAEPALHARRGVHGDHPRGLRALVPIEVPRCARHEHGLAAETERGSSPVVNVILPSVIVKSSSSAMCRCGGGPPPAPTRQSSANIEPPDSSPVTRNVYMSPGPHQERPASPVLVCTTPPSTRVPPLFLVRAAVATASWQALYSIRPSSRSALAVSSSTSVPAAESSNRLQARRGPLPRSPPLGLL